MAKRNTVNGINIEYLTSCLAANGWSNAYFCVQLMGKGRGWISEWKRSKNLPSPEEAARMCLLLNTTPEEILRVKGETDEETAKLQADIELVKGLIEQEREKQGIKKDLPVEVDGLTMEDWERQAEKWSDSEITRAMQKLLSIQERRQSGK